MSVASCAVLRVSYHEREVRVGNVNPTREAPELPNNPKDLTMALGDFDAST